jgi:hypothetical protein
MSGVVTLDHHIWLTDDGRHVAQGDPAASVLAYPAGQPVPAAVVTELDAATKQAAPPANKARKPAANK